VVPHKEDFDVKNGHNGNTLLMHIIRHLLFFTSVTDEVSPFMKEMLCSYPTWYNKKYGHRGSVFERPFNSVFKNAEEWIIKSKLYVLQNPINVIDIKTPDQAKWSSYKCHFSNNLMSGILKIDTSHMDNFCQTKSQLDKSIMMEHYIKAQIGLKREYMWRRLSN